MRRARSLAGVGLLIAVVAEGCSVGLAGLAGWFIASSAVAGATAYSLFSYMDPSGGVRALAVGRIAAGYANRVVLHAAALRRISTARLRFYDRAAAAPASHTAWSGRSLDRAMADADTTGMALIQTTTPVLVAAAMTAAGCLAITLAGYPWLAAIVAVAACLCAALALASLHRFDDIGHARAALRTELVTAVDAWPEMASLGATGHLAARTLRQLTAYEDRLSDRAQASARRASAARAVSAATLTLVVLTLTRGGAHASSLVLVALLAVGVMGNAERLIGAAEAHRLATQAGARLDSAIDTPRTPFTPAVRTRYAGHSLTLALTLSERRRLQLEVQAGRTLVLTGASGSGKTTLLNAIAAALRAQATHATTVFADDYLFTGTIATNIRLANPSASDTEINDLLASLLLDRGGLEPDTPIGIGDSTLSPGEQRRLQIARALSANPDVLLIDEPTTSLDANTATHILTTIRERLPHAVLLLAMHEPPADPTPIGPDPTTLPL